VNFAPQYCLKAQKKFLLSSQAIALLFLANRMQVSAIPFAPAQTRYIYKEQPRRAQIALQSWGRFRE